jgi:myosin heavy subunit
VTVKSEIQEMLRKNLPCAEIEQKTRSKSVFYECLTEYLAELKSEVEATRAMQREENEKCQETKDENAQLLAQRSEHSNEVQTLRTEKEALATEVENLRKELKSLHEDAELLTGKGFTPQIMTKLKAANDTDAGEVDAFLQQRERRNELDVAVATLEKNKLKLGRAVDTLSSRARNLEKEVASQENRVDLLKAQGIAYEAVVDVVNAAIVEGYTPGQLKALVLLLRKLEVKGDPSLSLKHLIDCVAEARSLLTLKREVDLAEKRLEGLLKAEGEVSSRIEQAQSAILGGLEKAQVQREEVMKKFSAQATAEEKRLALQSLELIKGIGAAAREAIQRETKVLAELRAERARIEQWVELGRALFDLVQSPDGLNAISPALVIALLQNVAYWIDLKFADFAVGAVYDGAIDEFRFFDTVFPKFRVSALIKLARESVAREIALRSRKES